MRTCAVPGCKGRYSQSGSRVHKLPDIDPMRSTWIKLIPSLSTASVKVPSVGCIHFNSSDYGGKNKKYLKPDAIPTRYLDLKEMNPKLEDLDTHTPPAVIDIPYHSTCARKECSDIYLKAKILQTENRGLRKHIKNLEKKLKVKETSESEKSPVSKKDCIKKVLEDCSMLGPTQIKCLANGTTKGRGWTDHEKSKGLLLKAMCNQKCYNYVRKNLVPMPCIWELNNHPPSRESLMSYGLSNSQAKSLSISNTEKTKSVKQELEAIKLENIKTHSENVVECVSHVASEAEVISDNVMTEVTVSEEDGQTVHHVVVAPEVIYFFFKLFKLYSLYLNS